VGDFNICKDCKFWSQMIAQVLDGDVQALCLNYDESPYKGKYTRERQTCVAFEKGTAVDDPKLRYENVLEEPEPMMYKPTEKSPEITEMLEDVAGRTTAIKSSTCTKPPFGCGKPVTKFREALNEREYTISGLCQECQDSVFGK